MAVSIETRPTVTLPVGAAPPRRGHSRRKLRDTPLAYLFLAPALVMIATFHFFPVFYAFWISLRNWGVIDRGMLWFRNYDEALHDHNFWQSLGTTLYFAIGTVPVTMALACLIAYLLYQNVRFLGVFRTLYFLPYVTSTVASITHPAAIAPTIDHTLGPRQPARYDGWMHVPATQAPAPEAQEVPSGTATQTQALLLFAAVQTVSPLKQVPHSPQQPVPHGVPELQTQAPLLQVFPGGQLTPQAPQWLLSVCLFTHIWPHKISPLFGAAGPHW